MVLHRQNSVPRRELRLKGKVMARPSNARAALDEGDVSEPSPVATRTVRRALAARESAYLDEVQRLLDAGLDLMVELGDERAPRVAEIVERAGLSNQAFYRHFAGKDELIAAVVEAGVHRLESYLRHQLDKIDDPERKVRAWITGVAAQAQRKTVARQTRAAMRNLRQLPVEVRQTVSSPATDDLLVDALRDAGSPDPERDAAAISLVAFGRLEQFLWQSPPSHDDVEHLIEFCLAAIRR
jgi:AcrR family transcriptional regulator